MIIIGIDPGTAILGYGVLEFNNNNTRILDYGVITTDKNLKLKERLCIIEKQFIELIQQYKPDEIAIEELYFQKNVKTCIDVAHIRGVILLNSHKLCKNVFEYNPINVKQTLTGYGHADKLQIQKMIKILFKLDDIIKPDDASDAIAIALTHIQHLKINTIKGQQEK